MLIARNFLFLGLILPCLAVGQGAPLRAFYGAQGFGSLSTGGRGGDVYIVTNLADSGPGSLRYGLERASGPRTVVFEVGGVIEIEGNLRIREKSHITIAGQTAPGEGILLKGGTLQVDECDNLIVRHLRVRYGWDSGDNDAVSVSDTTDSIFDHISASWGMDETFSLTGITHRVTVQDCIISEGVRHRHQYGMLIDTNESSGGRITLFRNLFSSHLGRMPRANSSENRPMLLEMINNVIYNWGTGGDWAVQGTALDAQTQSTWNFVNNYSIAGQTTFNEGYGRTILRGGEGRDRFHISGNVCDPDRDGILDGVPAGWDFVIGDYIAYETPFAVPDWAQVTAPSSAPVALEKVIDQAGAFPKRRDAVDTRLISELQSWGTSGYVSGPANRPEWPTLAESLGPADTDRDGKPDYWEEWYGTPTDIASNNRLGQDGYTALELYLDWLIHPWRIFALGDRDGNHSVDSGDLLPLIENWGETGKTYLEGDLGGDGRVDFRDLAIVAGRWGWRGEAPEALD